MVIIPRTSEYSRSKKARRLPCEKPKKREAIDGVMISRAATSAGVVLQHAVPISIIAQTPTATMTL
jgi:hypothetical protein